MQTQQHARDISLLKPSTTIKWRNLTSITLIWIIIILVTVSCKMGQYWTPPHSTATVATDISFLYDTPDPRTLTPDVENTEITGTTAPPPGETPTNSNDPTPTDSLVNTSPILYYTQAADTLPVIAVRYRVQPEQITSPDPIPPTSLLNPNQLLIIPRRLANTTSSQHLLPDSEVIYSPSAVDFDVTDFVNRAGGKLSRYTEWLKSTKTTTGADIVQRVALENSINPRLLLSLLEHQSHWVYGEPTNIAQDKYPMGNIDLNKEGLYRQLVWAVNQLSIGYYSWREGRLTEIYFPESDVTARLAPDLNAGTVALQYLFAQLYDSAQWLDLIDFQNGFPSLHEEMFGSPWLRSQSVEPLYPPGIKQPPLILPFTINRIWSYTGGPHGAWEHDGSYAALDFAPSAGESGCIETRAWVVASASGVVARSDLGVVVLDLDGDGYEQTGWVLIYLHVSSDSSIPVGTWVDTGDHLGHPSCEGGMATGTHVHIARKYNGEWIAADGPIPFVLSGWRAHAGEDAYLGTLTRDDETVTACTCASIITNIRRTENDE